jgi:hypothetical protein
MQLFFYTATGAGKLAALLAERAGTNLLHYTTQPAELVSHLRTHGHCQDIVVLALTTTAELETFLAATDLFDDVRLILILPNNSPEMVSRGHQLRPRFVDTCPDQDCGRVLTVLDKMLAAPL